MAGPARQLGLFGDGGDAPAVLPAEPSPEALDAGRRLPDGVRLGTSSWSFPGWEGLVYAGAVPRQALAREGLAAYARHPILRCVGLDRTFYGPVSRGAHAAYAASVPPDFRFLVKAPAHCTFERDPSAVLREPGSAASGAAPANPRYLDPAFAAAAAEPVAEGLGARLGALVLQFPPQRSGGRGGAARFAERLHAFLRRLPRLPEGAPWAVEIRTAGWLGSDYAAALREAGAVHCVTVHPSMPDVDAQVEAAVRPDGPLVVRWMLGHGRGYEEARRRYHPFDRLVDEDPATRDALARQLARAAREGRAALVSINNKAEGSAPLSALRLGQRVAELVA